MKRPHAVYRGAYDIRCPLIYGEGLTTPNRVTVRSSHRYQEAVYQCARYFRREFDYDWVQYEIKDCEDPTCVAFMWFPWDVSPSDDFWLPVVGACCFRRRENGWALQWVWMHPFFRRQGLLRQAWAGFRAEFGDFEIETPSSNHLIRDHLQA